MPELNEGVSEPTNELAPINTPKIVTPYDWSPVDKTSPDTIYTSLANKPEPVLDRDKGTPEPLTFLKGRGEASTWEKLSTSFSSFNSISNISDVSDLTNMRAYGKDFNVPDSELLAGVPEEYQTTVLNEAVEHNEQSALMLRDQILQDVQNETIFDNMEWYAQLGYGALASIADPISILPTMGVAKGVQAARAWQATGMVKNTAVMGSWAAGGGIEGATMNAPRLLGDHTYTVQDYELDVMVDSAVGFGLGALVPTAGIVKDWVGNKVNSNNIVLKQKEAAVEERKKKLEDPNYKELAATPELIEVQRIAETKQAPMRFNKYADKLGIRDVPKKRDQEFSATEANAAFEPIGAIDKISAEGMNIASSTTTTTFKPNTPMRKLINNVVGLNNKLFNSELKEDISKINADVVRLMSLFPDGKIPDDVNRKISGVTWTQVKHNEVNALDNILSGKTADTTGQLRKYVDFLESKDLWGGFVPPRVKANDFYKEQSNWLQESDAAFDDTIDLGTQVPKELSYLKDVVELNKLAVEKQSAEFTELVERINGMALRRAKAKQSNTFENYTDSTKSWGQEVPMSPPEIAKQLKAEGLVPRTPEYKARLEFLKKHGRAGVSADVNKIGRLDDQTIGIQLREQWGDDVGKLDDLGEVELIKGDMGQDLLPRKYIETEKESAFKNPTKESLKVLRDNIRSSLLKHTGVLSPISKKEGFAQQARLTRITKELHKNRNKVIDRLVKSGRMENVVDVIRASNRLAQMNIQKSKLSGKEQVKDAIKPLQLNEEHIDQLHSRITPTIRVPEQELNQIKEEVKNGYDFLVEESAQRWAAGLTEFVQSGEQEVFQLALKPKGILDAAGRLAARWTEDLATKFHKSNLVSMNYIGARVTEVGRGFGGSIRRKATGGIIREHTYRESITRIAKPYVDAVDKFATSKGRGAVRKLFATQRAGADDELVKEFNRSVFKVQELRRQGKEIPRSIDKSVLDFVDQWNKYMEHNHNKMVENNVAGFTKDRKVSNYIPHVWVDGKFNTAINKYGRAHVVELLRRGYVSSSSNGNNPLDPEQAKEAAEALLDWVLDKTKTDDLYSPVTDSRAKQRTDIDTTVEFEGLSVMDLLDDEVIQVATKYSNRMAGWVGLTKSTDGLIKNQLDIDTLKANMIQEGKDKGVSTKTEEVYFDDLMNLMFGRPTRGGLKQELRQLKDLTALTRMGGLGTAQLIESGQVITRGVIQTFSEPKMAQKLLGAAKGTQEHDELIKEIQSISSISDEFEWLDRQSVHLDQHELSKVHKARQLSLSIADKATWGSLKAPASRLLGKVSGYNMVRRIQSRVTQASFTLDVANHFKHGTGKMGNKRMADVGLTDTDGLNDSLEGVFKNLADWDDNGNLVKLNFEKWPKDARETFQYALTRDESQQIMRAHIGELPPWMNRPIMGLIFQFRQMPIVSQNKSMSRNLAFADKEAVLGVTLNAALAGLVRYSKFAALGGAYYVATGEPQPSKGLDLEDSAKYVAQFGMYADAYDLVLGNSGVSSIEDREDVKDVILRQIPVLGLMKDYVDTTVDAAQLEANLDSAQGLVPLGNTLFGELTFKALIKQYED